MSQVERLQTVIVWIPFIGQSVCKCQVVSIALLQLANHSSIMLFVLDHGTFSRRLSHFYSLPSIKTEKDFFWSHLGSLLLLSMIEE